ncbi:MAG TPA: ZIP family metal transporter [Flavobacteriales bacterium]|nr:ZIP family metal transporter [Flavobacteriales bacterium]
MTYIVALLFFALPMVAGAAVRVVSPDQKWLRLLLGFSGAFLVSVVFLHMLPELYEEEGATIGAWVLGGFLLQVILEFFSEGIEHGHIHVHAHHGAKAVLPWLTMASLFLHSFTEGMPFADEQVSGNVPFLAGVLLHKVPMAIALATVLLKSGVPSGSSWLMLVLFALAAPLGIGAGTLAGDWMDGHFLHHMLGLAIGMLLHIGTTIIFESAPDHRFNAARFAAVIVGVVLAALAVH